MIASCEALAAVADAFVGGASGLRALLGGCYGALLDRQAMRAALPATLLCVQVHSQPFCVTV